MKIYAVPAEDRSDELIKNLTDIWEDSVRATHLFLTENDIAQIRPQAAAGLKHVSVLLVIFAGSTDIPAGFAGISRGREAKLEMLFVSPDYFGKGYGYRLILKCFSEYNVDYVDVNEQNPDALKFYQRQGFKVFDRSETDDMGRPFPILHLKR